MEMAEALINKNDYYPAVERLAEAIEVSQLFITKSFNHSFDGIVLSMGCASERVEISML